MSLEFGNCVLDLERRELYRASIAIATPPRVFDLLVYLVQNHERVVSRDDLLEVVWNGRIVSESTMASHINAVRKAVGDNGHKQCMIRTFPRKGFRFIAELREATSINKLPDSNSDVYTELSTSSLSLPLKPSIAVLPFVNLSGDQDQDYLTDGVVEDIIAALSRYRWLFVVARNSSFTYKDRVVDVKQVGRELGVRYVLEGSLRKSVSRVRITGQLIDTETGSHHWAGHFEGVLHDIFDLQDQLTENMVGAIAPQLERVEIERTRNKPTESFDAYDYYLRGMSKLHQGDKENVSQALPLFQKAIGSDPEYASAYAMAAWCYCWRKVNGWMTDRPQEIADGIQLARRAIELDKSDATALTRSGHTLGHLTGDLIGGIALIDRALVLNPNLAAAWFLGAFLRVWQGETEEALEYFTRAMRLSPLDPEMYRMQAGMAIAHLFAGRFDTASLWAEKAFHDWPDFLMVVAINAASHALAGRQDQAKIAIMQLHKIAPNLHLSNLTELFPIQRVENLVIFSEGLRKAGLPE